MRLAWTAVAAASLIGGCATDDGVDDVSVADDALVAGSGILGPVRVEADRIVLRRAGNEPILSVRPGTPLVGAPDDGGGNPEGFLRKAVNAEPQGDEIVVVTEPGQLGDVIRSGTLRTSFDPLATRSLTTQSTPTGGTGIDYHFSPRTLLSQHANFRDPTGMLALRSFDIDRTVMLTGGHLRFTPSIETDLTIRRGRVDTFTAIARGELEASFALSFDMKTSVELDKNPGYRDALQRTLRAPALTANVYESPTQLIGVQWVGVVPVVETVRYRVVLECDLQMNSVMHGDASLEVRSRAAFGASYRGGEWKSVEQPSLTATPKFVLTRQGEIAGTCGLRGEVGLYFYDLAGPTLAITPYAVYDVDRAGDAWAYTVSPGIRGTFGGRAQVLGWELLRRDLVLFDVRASTPLRGTF
jgi:hypothetical protein